MRAATSSFVIPSLKHIDGRAVLIQADNVTIENCRFSDLRGGGIQFKSGYTYDKWCEGTGVNNVVVRNCVFDTVSPCGNKLWDAMEYDLAIGGFFKTDPSDEASNYAINQNILIENNIFKNTFGIVAYISSGKNIIFRNNTFDNTKLRLYPRSYRGSFFVKNASDIHFSNNRYITSQFVANPGIYFDSETTKNLISINNIIINK